MIGVGKPQMLRKTHADHESQLPVAPGRVIGTVGKIIGTYAARCLQGCPGAGYDDSSVNGITHSASVMTFGTIGVANKSPTRGRTGVGVGLDMAACNVVWGMVEDE